MDSVLIVSNTEQSIVPLIEMLVQNSYTQIVTVANCGEARRLLMSRSFDLCIINTPLSDEFGERFATEIISSGASQVIILVRESMYNEVCSRVEDAGVYTISKPINKQFLWNALKMANATYNKLCKLASENSKLNKRIDDLKTINRAKCKLIQYLGVSEEQAHKYIEKQAMDLRLSKSEVARNILKTYEG